MPSRRKMLNLLVLVADQQRYDCIGHSGMRQVETPHIDALAQSGAWFSQAYTSTPTCCPARQSMLTGRTAENLQAYWNYDITMPVASVTPATPTWPASLAEAGYRNAFIGKWHVSPDFVPTDFGYETFYGVKDYESYVRKIRPGPGFTGGSLGEADNVPLEHSRTHIFAGVAIDRITKLHATGQPWHVRLDFPEPHPPYRPAGKFHGMYRPEDIPPWGSFSETFRDKPFIQRQQLSNWSIDTMSWDDWAPAVARYYSVISQYDEAIGRVLEALHTLGAMENTVIVYTSDHGDMAGAHRMLDKHYVMYDDVVRVPLVICGPGIDSRQYEDFVSNTLDLAPTILELMGIDPPDGMQGRSLVPLLHSRRPSDWPTEAVSTFNGSQFGLYSQRMIRTQEWKFVWNLTAQDELYHLTVDPNELTNEIRNQKFQDVRLDLKERLYARLKAWNDPLVKGRWLEPQLREHGSILTWEMPPTL